MLCSVQGSEGFESEQKLELGDLVVPLAARVPQFENTKPAGWFAVGLRT